MSLIRQSMSWNWCSLVSPNGYSLAVFQARNIRNQFGCGNMKNPFKPVFFAVGAALTVASVSNAQNTAYNGDVLIGFTAGSGNDVIYDLGSVASLSNGETFPGLTSLLGGYNLSTVKWGVVGNTLNAGGRSTDNQIYTSTAANAITPGSISSSTYASAQTAVAAIYSGFPAAGAGNSLSIAANSSSGNSWYEQTVSPSLTTQYKNAYGDPTVTGTTSAALWSIDDQGGATVEVGTFTLNGSGSVTFNATAVPEPTAFALLACSGVVAIAIRRRLISKA
jgi:hypothetical protein